MEENQGISPTRRRRHSAEFKEKVILACMQPGVSIAAVALHYRLNANLLRRWVAEQEERDAAKQAREEMSEPSAQFVALQLDGAHRAAQAQDIVIEVRRGAATVTLRWPQSAAADCAAWLHGWLR
jgi:transposase-like protein